MNDLFRVRLDFPDNPALDDEFLAQNGATYRWDGTVWVPIGSGRDVYLPLAGGTMDEVRSSLTRIQSSRWRRRPSSLRRRHRDRRAADYRRHRRDERTLHLHGGERPAVSRAAG